MTDIKKVGADRRHDRVNDYKPAEPTEEELKRAGVTLVGFDSALIYLKCDHCKTLWATPRPERRENNWPYWICPNALADGSGDVEPVEVADEEVDLKNLLECGACQLVHDPDFEACIICGGPLRPATLDDEFPDALEV